VGIKPNEQEKKESRLEPNGRGDEKKKVAEHGGKAIVKRRKYRNASGVVSTTKENTRVPTARQDVKPKA